MYYIDAFNHFFPKQLWDRIQKLDGAGKDIGRRMQGVPCIYDLETRFRVMDEFSDYRQIISLGMPPLEAMGGPELATEFARIANDGQAELVEKYPERFAGFVAALPMNAPDAAVREAERAFTELGANGLQIHTNVNGAPLDEERFFPIFEAAAKHNKPVLLHPSRTSSMADYATEDKSKYEIWWTFGWPYETSAAMARLVFSGFMDRLPNLKVLAHHMGAMVPYFEGRVGPGWDQLGKRTSDEDLSLVLKRLKKRPLDYFKDFYADTAVFGSRAATLCGLEFYGSDRILFASDSPFDPEKGPGYIRDTLKILNSLDLSKEDMEKICFRNAETLFGLKS
ncbi:aminocarboxymuconate-semialdehyde decarboxylase [Rhizobium sp. BK529]|uniref:amidohydrolase family protein n=1 Tax=unclassified Rhizobium TaxID=2613769 RepID=UPI00104C9B98|nr:MULTISPECIES: amidohydrolase family protein [unclassified Rhizobium]MBB3595817.1 aminocarboxymuconate-semialdehyde decarboxylase [Rhizobium sp. BK529]TCR95158.1 aminocarboxymuconate-semialdehyde decarboxylase [Rhizobium sp. BK418]